MYMYTIHSKLTTIATVTPHLTTCMSMYYRNSFYLVEFLDLDPDPDPDPFRLEPDPDPEPEPDPRRNIVGRVDTSTFTALNPLRDLTRRAMDASFLESAVLYFSRLFFGLGGALFGEFLNTTRRRGGDGGELLPKISLSRSLFARRDFCGGDMCGLTTCLNAFQR
jgi:hypothetical protein